MRRVRGLNGSVPTIAQHGADRDERDHDEDESPETPTDEPRVSRVQDSPPQPDHKGLYVGTVREQQAWRIGTVDTRERKERRGFASMSPEKQREIASKGGRAAHEKGTAHEWSADEARAAGRKGGQVSRGGRGRLTAPETPTAMPAVADENVQ
jgi:general stress protein YciG